jgi:hypothetical protein
MNAFSPPDCPTIILDALSGKNTDLLDQVLQPDIIYYDPLHGYFEQTYVWQLPSLFAISMPHFSWQSVSEIRDEGDGYFTSSLAVSFASQKKAGTMPVTLHWKMVDGKVAEMSLAFRVHTYLSKRDGFAGTWFGWNRFYQRSVSNKIKKRWLQQAPAK